MFKSSFKDIEPLNERCSLEYLEREAAGSPGWCHARLILKSINPLVVVELSGTIK